MWDIMLYGTTECLKARGMPTRPAVVRVISIIIASSSLEAYLTSCGDTI